MSKIYLIPNSISEGVFHSFNLSYYSEAICDCQLFFAENLKPARRLLKFIVKDFDFTAVELLQCNSGLEEQARLKQALQKGENIGVISDAGLPGIADPGQEIVRIGHQFHAKIIPLVGPSAIFMALMASGCQGQRFNFHGYLPIEKNTCAKQLKTLIFESRNRKSSQIFIETPHRNNSLLQLILQIAPSETLLCIALNIGAPDAFVQTKNIGQWRRQIPILAKKPCTFILYLE